MNDPIAHDLIPPCDPDCNAEYVAGSKLCRRHGRNWTESYHSYRFERRQGGDRRKKRRGPGRILVWLPLFGLGGRSGRRADDK